MRAGMIATVSALALLAGPAFAQTSTTTPGTSPRSTAAAPAPAKPSPDPLKMEDVSKISGSAVYGSDDKKIGDVSTVLMKPEEKKIDRLVVSEGGVLGVGAHHVALPVDEFKWDGQKDAFKISKTADEVKKMPEWKEPTEASASTAPSSGSSTAPAAPSTSHVAPPSASGGTASGGAAGETKTKTQ